MIGDRNITLISLVILITADLPGLTYAQPADFDGTWMLDVAASDALEPKLERIRRHRASDHDYDYGSHPDQRSGSGGTIADQKERAYWDHVRSAREVKRLDAPIRLGPIHPILTAEVMGITWNGSELKVNYDQKLDRVMSPNPNGRVFSASGEELIRDEIGHTLSYWRDGRLIVETTTHRGGRLVERLALSSDKSQLRVHLTLDRPGWSAPLALERVFDAVR